jgi:galactokinase
MAINLGTSAVFAANNTSSIRIYSSRFNEEVRVTPNDILASRNNHWGDYVAGVCRMLGYRNLGNGFDMFVDDDISSGGLSSSASFSVAIAIAAYTISNGRTIELQNTGERLHLALQCQRAENEYVGVSCGIMDQASILIGGIIKLNCNTLAFEQINQEFFGHSIVVMDTGKERTLAGSMYNKRVSEVNEIRERLKGSYDFRDVAQLEPELLEEASRLLERPVLAKRLRHIVTEEQRVIHAREAMKDGNMMQLGQLMNSSHQSLANDYEVTGVELDTITELSRNCSGVLGSRMTGAGFGGCAISLIEDKYIVEHNELLARDYLKKTGLKAEFHQLDVSAGAQDWSL